ncbi:MAG: hypothetical protein ACRDHW_00235 [Ktedonobacteraceae bacterium]
MTTNAQAYKHAAYPQTPWFHLSDEDIVAQLDQSAQRSRAARKAHETIRQRRAEQQKAQEKSV